MNFLQQIEAIWRNVSLVQRAMLLAITLTFIIGAGLLVNWARQPDMRVLYSGLDAEEAGKICDKISEKDIVYKLGSSGTTIYVPSEHVTQLRLDMAKDGLPNGGNKGYSLFDDQPIGMSPMAQSVNLKRAIQDELARSIEMIDGVSHARIHIVNPEHTLFASTASEPSAAVVLRIQPGHRLSATNVAAIRHLVAGGVEGLSSEKVTVINSGGQLLSNETDDALAGGAGTVADYRERVEQSIADKVEDMLTAVLGPGRAMVKVSADIDMTSSNTARETYDETGNKAVPMKEEITSGSGEGASMKSEIIITDYSVPKTVQQTVVLAGEIKALTVAAFVDLSPPEAAKTEEDGEAADTETAAAAVPIMDIAEVTEIIQKAVGPKLAADGLKVVDVKFNRPTDALLAEDDSGGLNLVAIAKQASLGIMAVCALLALKMFSGAKKKAGSMPATGELASGNSGGGFLPDGSNAPNSLALSRQVAASLQSNPEQARQLFSRWLEEDGA
ncbi:MAG: flagellar M-ring protein FliF [Planctomycetes bacterium]|nr:flagellar M-ring protein FliF [Planctomycetota bacterium]